jgi:hypothetical protein
MTLNADQAATLAELERVKGSVGRIGPFGKGAARALQWHLQQGRSTPEQQGDLERVNRLLAADGS